MEIGQMNFIFFNHSHNAPQCALLIFFTCLTPDDFTFNGETLQLNGLTKKSDNVSS